MKELMLERIEQRKPVFNFGQAVTSFAPPQAALEQIKNFTNGKAEVHRLGNVPGLPALRKAISDYRVKAYKEDISEKNVLVTSGANHAFLLSLLGITDIGESAMLLSPYFFNHAMMVPLTGTKLITCPLDEKNEFQPDLKRISQKWRKTTKVLVIVNPGNPTGTIIKRHLLKDIQDFVKKKNAWLIIDESYLFFDYREEPETLPYFELEHTILIGSFSKSFSLSGWRIGYLIGQEYLISQLVKAQDASIICPSVPAQEVALAALQQTKEHFGSILPELKRRRVLLEQGLRKMNTFEKIHGEGGIFLFCKLKDTPNDFELAKDLVKNIGVVTSPGSAWGKKGYLRFSYGLTDKEIIQKGTTIMKNYFDHTS